MFIKNISVECISNHKRVGCSGCDGCRPVFIAAINESEIPEKIVVRNGYWEFEKNGEKFEGEFDYGKSPEEAEASLLKYLSK